MVFSCSTAEPPLFVCPLLEPSLAATDRDASPARSCSQPLEEPPLYYDKKADRDESERNDPNYVIVSHRYQVLRYLPSPVQAVNVSFLVPVNVTDADGRQLRVVDVYRPVAAVEGRPLSCSIQTGYFLASVSSQAAQIRWCVYVQRRRWLCAAGEMVGHAGMCTDFSCLKAVYR